MFIEIPPSMKRSVGDVIPMIEATGFLGGLIAEINIVPDVNFLTEGIVLEEDPMESVLFHLEWEKAVKSERFLLGLD